MDWIAFKNWIPAVTGLPKDTVHIYVAVLIQLGAAAVFRKNVGHLLPWLTVLAVEVGNEALDTYLPGDPVEQWQIDGAIHDLWNTMLLQTLLLLTARIAPRLLASTPRAQERSFADPPSEQPLRPPD